MHLSIVSLKFPLKIKHEFGPHQHLDKYINISILGKNKAIKVTQIIRRHNFTDLMELQSETAVGYMNIEITYENNSEPTHYLRM